MTAGMGGSVVGALVAHDVSRTSESRAGNCARWVVMVPPGDVMVVVGLGGRMHGCFYGGDCVSAMVGSVLCG